jgi:tetratricopeptide (TPR) repeat protein
MDPRHLQRFQNEARAAAGLHHTNIVPVFGVGSDRGVHYYAMQLIEGQSLAEAILAPPPAANAGALQPKEPPPTPMVITQQSTVDHVPGDPSEDSPDFIVADTVRPPAATTDPGKSGAGFYRYIAALCIQAADALDYAHGMGIVHRDIKPSNLMLDQRGTLWVTDFGLAQIQSDSRMTMTGDLLGTLRYMSPEQALAKPKVLDHRTDIYSLGATLYELLTKKPAFPGNDRQELLRMIAFEEPIAPRKIRKDLPPELETIVLKAMAKAPEERYGTAKELADDLRNYLEFRLLRARRPTIRQRIAKWARRNQAAVWTALGVMTVLVAVLATSTAIVLSQRNAERLAKENEINERKRAEAAQKQALTALQGTTDDVVEKLIGTKPVLGPLERAFLDKTLSRWQAFADEQGESEQARLVRAEGVYRVADLRRRLGEREGALGGFEQAKKLLGQLSDDFPSVALYREKYCACQGNQATLLVSLGRHNEAEAILRQTVKDEQKLVDEFSDNATYRRGLATSQNNLANLLELNNKLDQAEALYREALKTRELLAKQFYETPQCAQDLAATHTCLGSHFEKRGNSAAAAEELEKARTLLEILVGAHDNVPEFKCDLARNNGGLVRSLFALKRPQDAAKCAANAQNMLEDLAKIYPAVPEYRHELATIHFTWGGLVFGLGKQKEAEKSFEAARTILEKLVKESPAPDYRSLLAKCNYNLGSVYPDFANMQTVYLEAIELQEALVKELPEMPQYRYELGASLFNYAQVLRENKQPELALEWNAKAISTAEELQRLTGVNAATTQSLRDAHWDRARILDELRKHPEAAPHWDIAVNLSPQSERLGLRLGRALSRVRAGNIDAAIKEAEALSTVPNPEVLYDAACVFAVAGERSEESAASISREECCKRAIALLRQAVAKGFADVEHLKKDQDLKVLHDRVDYKNFLESLNKKSP